MKAGKFSKVYGERIRKIRKERNLSLDQFSKELGNISKSHLWKVEKGQIRPNVEMLSAMHSRFGIDMNEFFESC